jgi:phage shock protein PspC (stress-responsive transcriptional regulator)
MKRVITASLQGYALHLDEDAYDDLQAYLARAEAQLAGSPDCAEILADLERAICEKSQPLLTARKTVLTLPEMGRLLEELGPVDPRAAGVDVAGSEDPYLAGGGANPRDAAGPAQNASAAAPRRLLQVRDGAMISGVCNGLARYFGFDVTLVRIVFVILALVTSGTFLLLYLVLMFVVPYDTHADRHPNESALAGWSYRFVTGTKRQFAGS